MKIKNILFLFVVCCSPVGLFAQSMGKSAVPASTNYEYDGPILGISRIEIGGHFGSDGYEADYFSVPSIKKAALNDYSEFTSSFHCEEIDANVFREAYRRVKIAGKDIYKDLLQEYRQVKAEYYLTKQEWEEANAELVSIQNTWDWDASFQKYPYLIDVEYRRSPQEIQQKIAQYYKKHYAPLHPSCEPMDSACFKEAYQAFKADPRSAKAHTARQVRNLFTRHYRQLRAGKKTRPVK